MTAALRLATGSLPGGVAGQVTAAGFLARGGIAQTEWRARAASIHHAFIARRLSPGGCADLLAITLFLDAMEAHP